MTLSNQNLLSRVSGGMRKSPEHGMLFDDVLTTTALGSIVPFLSLLLQFAHDQGFCCTY